MKDFLTGDYFILGVSLTCVIILLVFLTPIGSDLFGEITKCSLSHEMCKNMSDKWTGKDKESREPQPSVKDIVFVMNATTSPYNEAKSILIELDNNVTKAIQYFENRQ